MKVVVTGATGVLGRSAVRSLVSAGHEVHGLVRSAPKAHVLAELGAVPERADLFDVDALGEAFSHADAVVNLATHVPVGYSGVWPWAWRTNDRIHAHGSARVVEAARRAGVRRLVQESVSSLYAERGEIWVDEESPIEITPATEPAAVAEAEALDFADAAHVAVVLRFGSLVGDDPETRRQLNAAAHGRAIGTGEPEGWAHVVHTDDVGPAIAAALSAPTGVFNVGADPVRRRDLVAGFARAAGVDEAGFLGPLTRRLAGPRAEPLSRSLRVSSDRFIAQTGWTAARPEFGAGWLRSLAEPVGARR